MMDSTFTPIAEKQEKTIARLVWHFTRWLLAFLLLSSSPAFSQSASNIRMWTVKGEEKSTNIEGRPVKLSKGQLTFRDRARREHTSPLKALSTQDQRDALSQVVGSGIVVVHAKDDLDHEFGSGSGFIFHKNGWILTNYHVISNAWRVEIEFRDTPDWQTAECFAFDRNSDVAILRVKQIPANTHVLELAMKGLPTLTSDVWTISHPSAQKYMLSWGKILSIHTTEQMKRRSPLFTDAPANEYWIESTVVTYPGSSGGPLLDASGQVIGINQSVIMHQTSHALHIAQIRRAYRDAQKATQPLLLPLGPAKTEPTTNVLSREIAPIYRKYQTDLTSGIKSSVAVGQEEKRHEEIRLAYRQQIMDFVRNNPESWQAVQAICLLLMEFHDNTEHSSQCKKEACDILLTHHQDHRIIVYLLPVMVHHADSHSLHYCETVAKQHPTHEVQQMAKVAVAMLKLRLPEYSSKRSAHQLRIASDNLGRIADELTSNQNFGSSYPVETALLAQDIRSQLDSLRLGSPAAPTQGFDLAGEFFDLRDYRGNVVLLTCFSNSSPESRRMYPFARAIMKKYSDKAFVVLGINTDPEYVLKRLVSEKVVTWRCWADDEEGPIAIHWQFPCLPKMYLIDKSGFIRCQWDRVPVETEAACAIEALLK